MKVQNTVVEPVETTRYNSCLISTGSIGAMFLTFAGSSLRLFFNISNLQKSDLKYTFLFILVDFYFGNQSLVRECYPVSAAAF